MNSPLNNQSYDLISMLDNKLEALQAYDRYKKDMDSQTRQMLDQIRDDDYRHAQMIAQEIERIARDGGLVTK